MAAPWLFLALWLTVVNRATWIVFAADKRAALRKARRIPERTLLTLALIGGSPAAVAAQRRLRHKTRKQPFAGLLLTIVALQIAALLAVMAFGLHRG